MPAFGKITVERFEVFMSGAGPTMQQQHFDAGIVADPLGPDAKSALGRLDRNQLGAAGQDIVAAG